MCSQSTVSQKKYQGCHFLPFHLFNFLTITFFKVFSSFNQFLGASYLILGAGLVVKASCQIILYSSWFPILIFKFNFAISSLSNFLRKVQLKWFHFKYLTYYWISNHGNYFLTNQTKPFWTFFLVVKFQTFCPSRIFTILSY